MSKYMNRKNASEKLGIHYHTLYAMAERGDIETIKIGKQQMYNVDKYLKDKEEANAIVVDAVEHAVAHTAVVKRNICYCRVSNDKQKTELKRQIVEMKKAYLNYEIISDIGSSHDFERPGLKQIIDYAMKGEIGVVVITSKDRLARSGYGIIENLIKDYSKGRIEIKNDGDKEIPQDEMAKDLTALMNMYVAKANELRK